MLQTIVQDTAMIIQQDSQLLRLVCKELMKKTNSMSKRELKKL